MLLSMSAPPWLSHLHRRASQTYLGEKPHCSRTSLKRFENLLGEERDSKLSLVGQAFAFVFALYGFDL